jgi:HEAT repeat protein
MGLRNLSWMIALASLVVVGCNEPRFMGRTMGSWMMDLENDNDYARRAACEAIATAGAAGAPAVPAMAKLLDDVNDGVQTYAVKALAAVGPLAIPELEKVLAQEQVPNVRLNAATALVQIDPTNKSGRDALYAAFTGTGNAKIARDAGHIIVRQKGALVDLLLMGVQDTYEPIRIDSARLMGKIGRPAAAAIEPMVKLIQDESQPAMLRRTLVSALATVATKEQAAPVFQALVDNEEGDGDVTSMAGDMLRYIGEREAVSGNEVDPNSPEAKAAALEAEANALDAAAGK